MVTVKFIRSDGKEFFIDNLTWKVTSDGLDGFDTVDNIITNEDKAIGDGSDFIAERIGNKDRTIKAVLVNRKLNNTMRELVRSFFVPKYQFECHVSYNGINKWCRGRLYSSPMPVKNIYDYLELEVTLLCDNPFLFSEDNFAKDIAGVIGQLEFDLEITEDGVEFDSYEFANEVEINNDGDVETYCRAIIEANGEVVNPKLILGDYYIRLLDTLQDNDTLDIDLTVRPLIVKKNNENIIRLIDRTSNFDKIKFNVGKNMIGYGADSGDSNMSVTIYYNKRYIGL